MNYELVCILSPKINDQEVEQEIGKIDKILSENKVDNFEKNVWGKKELAYPIEKFFDGYYVQYNFELAPVMIGKIDNKLKLEEKIIRFLIIKQEVIKVEKPKEENKEVTEDDKVKKNKVQDVKIERKKEDVKKDFDARLEEALGKDLTD